MKWRKLGRVYCPDGTRPWSRSYALMPTVQHLDGDRLRIYYASLDEQYRGHIGVLDVDARQPLKILHDRKHPLLEPGTPGTFDDCGVNPSCIVQSGDHEFLYYLGWQRTEAVPQLVFAGAARLHGGHGHAGEITLERLSRTPMLERLPEEPFLRSATTIVQRSDSYECLYVCGDRWIEVSGKPYPTYDIRTIHSTDPLNWPGTGTVAIGLNGTDEYGLGRPWAVQGPDSQDTLYYSIRSTERPYRIGYAVSDKQGRWHRRDDLQGLEPSDTGWDSEMICYACVVDTGGERYLFYNGNQHGKTGFGVAILDQD